MVRTSGMDQFRTHIYDHFDYELASLYDEWKWHLFEHSLITNSNKSEY